MGLLRTLLALVVIAAHLPLGSLRVIMGGHVAVQLFYIISGFLITYVLHQSKRYDRIADFYSSRLVRIVPIYLAVALTTVAFRFACTPEWFELYHRLPWSADILLLIANMTIIGQDWVMFLGIYDSSLAFTADFTTSDILLYKGLLLPQAWTIGLELTFYALAPFIVQNRTRIIGILILSIMCRFLLIHAGLGMQDPWTYRFLPNELAFFMVGALSCHFLLPVALRLADKQPDLTRMMSRVATYALLSLVVFYKLLPLPEYLRQLLVFSAVIFSLPLLFIFQNHCRTDRLIGELSYPIYIVHLLVIYAWIAFQQTHPAIWSLGRGMEFCLLATCSVAAAIALTLLIGRPFEKFRQTFRSDGRQAPRTSPTSASGTT